MQLAGRNRFFSIRLLPGQSRALVSPRTHRRRGGYRNIQIQWQSWQAVRERRKDTLSCQPSCSLFKEEEDARTNAAPFMCDAHALTEMALRERPKVSKEPGHKRIA